MTYTRVNGWYLWMTYGQWVITPDSPENYKGQRHRLTYSTKYRTLHDATLAAEEMLPNR